VGNVFDGLTWDAYGVGACVVIVALLVYLRVRDFSDTPAEHVFGEVVFFLALVSGTLTACVLAKDCFWGLLHKAPITIGRSQCVVVLILALALAVVTAFKALTMYKAAKTKRKAKQPDKG
jgi:hypothetical protein